VTVSGGHGEVKLDQFCRQLLANFSWVIQVVNVFLLSMNYVFEC
jgi:hypothetical protein